MRLGPVFVICRRKMRLWCTTLLTLFTFHHLLLFTLPSHGGYLRGMASEERGQKYLIHCSPHVATTFSHISHGKLQNISKIISILLKDKIEAFDNNSNHLKVLKPVYPILKNRNNWTKILSSPAGAFDAPEGPKKPFPHVLILSSLGRSGSSFLGRLLGSLPGVFYLFEPFHSLRWDLTHDLALDSLRKLFTCNFTGPIYKSVRIRGQRAVYHPYAQNCRPKYTCFSPERLASQCLQEPKRLIKTIRTRVSWILPLLQDPKVDVAVIHLVRDPRGALLSYWRAGWEQDPEEACQVTLDDLRSGQALRLEYPERYLAVRYEDICADPVRMAGVILNFLGYSYMTQRTYTFVKTRTAGSATDNWVFGMHRDSYRQQQRWRQEISREDLLTLETSCAQTITTMGFTLFHSLEQARNTSVPLYKPSAADAAAVSFGAVSDAEDDAGLANGAVLDDESVAVNAAAAANASPVGSAGSANELFTYKHCEVVPDDVPS